MARVEFILNGNKITTPVDPSTRLLDFLRNDMSLTGVKEGCGEGECGACAVLLDGRIANSCMIPLANVHHREVTTIEGLRNTKRYEVLEKAFVTCGAVQCGFCTPGMIIASESLLRQNPHPSAEEIRIALSGNLCRCTGYNMIVKAVQTAAKDGDGLW